MAEDIHKAAGIIIVERKLLVERSFGKKFFISPGGSIEAGETPKQALVRELMEEFGITVEESDLAWFGLFRAAAANHPGQFVSIETYLVNKWQGEPSPHSEVEEMAWITSVVPAGMKVGSIFKHDVIPQLKQQNLMD